MLVGDEHNLCMPKHRVAVAFHRYFFDVSDISKEEPKFTMDIFTSACVPPLWKTQSLSSFTPAGR